MTGTTSNTQERFTQPKGSQQTLLLLALTCNKGLTNLEYKGTQQDSTDEKERLQGYASQGEIKISL
jgi:hypothetical protein